MYETAFIADPHVGNFSRFGGNLVAGINKRCSITLDCLDEAFHVAERAGCSNVVIAGDLFESDHPVPQILSAVQDIFYDHYKKVKIFVEKGNHDCRSYQEQDHALGPLRDYCTIYETVGVLELHTHTILFIPPSTQPASAYITEALGTIKIPTSKPVLMCLHTGISSKDTPQYLKSKPDSISVQKLTGICETHNIAGVLAGHWHRHKTFKNIVQIGGLCPRGFTDPGLDGYGSVVVCSGKEFKRIEISGPRFIADRHLGGTATKAWSDLESVVKESKNKIYAQITTRPEHAAELKATASTTGFAEYEVFVENEQAEETAQSLEEVSANEDFLLASVNNYVNNMQTDVDKDKLRTLVKDYLDGARESA